MTFLDAGFYVFLVGLLLAHRLVPAAWRSGTLLVAWVSWLAFHTPETLVACAGLAVWLRAGVHGLHLPRLPGRGIYTFGNVGILAIVLGQRLDLPWFTAPLEAVQAFDVWGTPGAASAVTVLGLSYAALKAHHVLFLARNDPDFRPSTLRILHYLVYLPTLASGPILRWREFESFGSEDPQLEDLDAGSRRIVVGLFKKVVVVHYLDLAVQALLDAPQAGLQLLVPYAFLLLLYFDFSGYSDVAIGIGRCFGHRVPENFKRPFTATSMSHFWRQWHATLTDWLREHLWIQLGGTRARGARLGAITVLVMLFCGVWHSISAPFALWGLYHGALLAGEEALGIRPLPPRAPQAQRLLRHVVIFQLVGFGALAFL